MPAATKPKPVISIEDITPSKAEKYLDRNTHNRTLRMPKAEALAEAIAKRMVENEAKSEGVG